jgi:lysophospholipase L1-like esterase
MSAHKPTILVRVPRSAAIAVVFAAVTAAHAQSLGPAPDPASPAAQPATPVAAAPAVCGAPTELSRLDLRLRRTARRLFNGEPLTIVAVGSSSTAGAGASSPAANYPSRLAVELQQRFPHQEITVVNRGVNGEETEQMMARFETGVFAEHPQLVVWQVGTNSVLRDHPLKPHSVLLHEGIDQIKATGADVVLMDPQYAPKVLAKSETPGMVDQIAHTAKEESVDLFHRFAIMRDWKDDQHLPFDTFVSADGLHMNDWGYACVAKLLAGAIAESATRAVASAAAHLPR